MANLPKVSLADLLSGTVPLVDSGGVRGEDGGAGSHPVRSSADAPVIDLDASSPPPPCQPLCRPLCQPLPPRPETGSAANATSASTSTSTSASSSATSASPSSAAASSSSAAAASASSASTSSRPPLLAPPSKRPRPASSDRELFLHGDDSALPAAEAAAWRAAVDRHLQGGTQFVDSDFPATQLSIRGKDEPDEEARPAPPPAVAAGEAPKCRCGVQATPATVGKDTPNKGRRYFHCPTRECGFFAWADGGEVTFRRGGSAAKLSWARLPLELHVVCDSGARADGRAEDDSSAEHSMNGSLGFRAEDLRQGGVGDCWFMSALAVVAQRHDLIARIFSADTARNAAGCLAACAMGEKH